MNTRPGAKKGKSVAHEAKWRKSQDHFECFTNLIATELEDELNQVEDRWKNWTKKMSVDPVDEKIRPVTLPRPGHADLAGVHKYDFDDIRNILERSSARETTMRVALGSVCRKLLEEVGIHIGSRVVQIHNVKDESKYELTPDNMNERADKSPVRCLDTKAEIEMIDIIDKAKKAGDSVGGVFEVIATGVPYGLSLIHI